MGVDGSGGEWTGGDGKRREGGRGRWCCPDLCLPTRPLPSTPVYSRLLPSTPVYSRLLPSTPAPCSALSCLDYPPRPGMTPTPLDARLQAALGTTYRIEQELGGGGMSRVFLAEEVALGRKVVIKVLPPEMVSGVNQDRFRARDPARRPAPAPPHRAAAGRRAPPATCSGTRCPSSRASRSGSGWPARATCRSRRASRSSGNRRRARATPTARAWSTATSSPTTSWSRAGTCW